MSGFIFSPLGTTSSDAPSATAPADPAAPPASPSLPSSGPGFQEVGDAPTDKATTTVDPAFFTTGPTEGGIAGEGGVSGLPGTLQVGNAEFIAAIFAKVPDNAAIALCHKAGDPTTGGWHAKKYVGAPSAAASLSTHKTDNAYLNCSTFCQSEDGSFKASKATFAACHFVVLDDIGTKISVERLGDFGLSWLIETSPNNFQGGIVFTEPVTDGEAAGQLLGAIIDAGLCDAGARQPMTRWARLPVGINGKPKYASEDGKPFQCRLVEWYPERRYTLREIYEGLKLRPAGSPKNDSTAIAVPGSVDGDDVLQPRAAVNPVIAELKAKGLYKTPLGGGKHDITCPWVSEHKDQIDSGTAYFEPDDQFPVGGFCCQHSHGDHLHLRQLIEKLGVAYSEARHKPVIRVVAGDLHHVVSAAEKELAARGRHYQSGGLVVSISTDPTTGDPAIVPTSAPALTRELSVAATWEKYDKRAQGWFRCDPPARHVAILYDAQNYAYLPALVGLARQPYFREDDGAMVCQPGYDAKAKRFGVFDPKQFPVGESTLDAAKFALTLLRELLCEFSFVCPTDEAAALAAIFTAVVRPSLPVAPAFHVRASVFGSGKSYLCEVIATFAGPGLSEKVSYPTTSEEATKVILALLMKNPACVEFDDMDGDWQPHGVNKRMLTSEKVSERILGVSKTATVSTRTLFLGSGNNVGPIRDMLRRVLTIHLDPRVETPATLTYKGDPVGQVKRNRGRYVMAVMTIIEAWRQAGKPRADCQNIVTYDGPWSDYCRHPLMWMGLPDPATALIEQVRHDPDADSLKGLMTAWKASFGSTPTTVRKAVAMAGLEHPDLLDAMREFPVEERGEINRSKLGWLLKKNANRIVAGFEFQKAEADGRTAWRVVAVNSSASPASPPSPPAAELRVKTVDFTSIDDEVDL